MKIVPSSNPSFIPSVAPAGVDPADHLANGFYAYINADKDPALKKRADEIFGRTVPFDNSETQATLIGRSFASRTGYRENPLAYLLDNNIAIPYGWNGENYPIYTIIGRDIIKKAQADYEAQREKEEQCIMLEKGESECVPPQTGDLSADEAAGIIAVALVGLFVAGWVLYAVAVVLLTIKDRIVQRVRGTCSTMRAGAPVIWQRVSSPEGMRAAFLVLVAALVLIALCLVVIACVLVF